MIWAQADCGGYGCVSNYYTNHKSYTNITSWETKTISQEQTWTTRYYFDEVLLDDLSDGFITFNVRSSLGDFYFDNAVLTVDVAQNPEPEVTELPERLPEPTALALMGLGLASLIGVNRRRNLSSLQSTTA